jgi:glutaredoxin
VVALLAQCCVSVMAPAYLATGFRSRGGVLVATLVFGAGVAHAMTVAVEVTLLTQRHCQLCEHAKQVLARVSQRYRLQITETDLGDEHGRPLAQRAGVMFAPGVLIDGRLFSFGRLCERRLMRELDRRLRACGS